MAIERSPRIRLVEIRYTNDLPRRGTKRTDLSVDRHDRTIVMMVQPSRRSHRKRNMGEDRSKNRSSGHGCAFRRVFWSFRSFDLFLDRRQHADYMISRGVKIEEESKTGRKSCRKLSINVCVCMCVCMWRYIPRDLLYIYIKFVYIYTMCIIVFFNPRRISFFFISFRQLSINK